MDDVDGTDVDGVVEESPVRRLPIADVAAERMDEIWRSSTSSRRPKNEPSNQLACERAKKITSTGRRCV